MPTTNVGDDLTWTKGKHTTFTAGIDLLTSSATRISTMWNSFPSYAFRIPEHALGGLGGDATTVREANYVNRRCSAQPT